MTSERRFYPSAELVERARRDLLAVDPLRYTADFVMGYISASTLNGYLDDSDVAMIVAYRQLKEEGKADEA